MSLKFDEVHIGQMYLFGPDDETVIVLAKQRDTGIATVEFQDDMKLRNVIAEQLHPMSVSAAPVYNRARKRVIKPIDDIEAPELSAAEDIKDALSGLARDLSEDGADDYDEDEHDDDFDDDGDTAPHEAGSVDPKMSGFSELLHDLGFDMGEIEMHADTVEFKGRTVGFLWGLLSGIDAGEFPAEEE